MTSSKYRAVRSMMSRCPLVTGSNEPGMRAIAKGDSLLSAGGPSHRHNRTAVALLSENFPTATEVQLPGGFDDHEASERRGQQVHPPVEVVRRVGERHVVVARGGHEAEHVAAHGRAGQPWMVATTDHVLAAGPGSLARRYSSRRRVGPSPRAWKRMRRCPPPPTWPSGPGSGPAYCSPTSFRRVSSRSTTTQR